MMIDRFPVFVSLTGLDFYKCIRMINHIRKQVLAQPELADAKNYAFTGSEDFWENDELLQPVLENDALLFAFEELEIADDTEEDSYAQEKQQEPQTPAAPDLSKIQPTTDLERQLLQLVQQTQARCNQVEAQYDEYKSMVKQTFLDNIADDTRR